MQSNLTNIFDYVKENIKDIELDTDSNLLRRYPEQKLGVLDLKAIIIVLVLLKETFNIGINTMLIQHLYKIN